MKKCFLKKSFFVKNEVWAFLLTLGSEPARKISPLASNMSPCGLTATHFVTKITNTIFQNQSFCVFFIVFYSKQLPINHLWWLLVFRVNHGYPYLTMAMVSHGYPKLKVSMVTHGKPWLIY